MYYVCVCKLIGTCYYTIIIFQGSLTHAYSSKFDDADTREVLRQVPEIDNMVKEGGQDDWIDMFIGQTNGLYPSTSAALMAHATNPNKTPEEQVADIKDMADQITKAIQSEMTNLLSYAIAHCEKGEQGGKQTKHKRSVETPMDSSQLVMRLLKHIKANNEYQNIAIEKMMTAQEIADKYGVKYTPDEDLLTDLVDYSSQQAEQLSSILTAAYNTNSKQVEFVPLPDIKEDRENAAENSTYYIYALHMPEDEIQSQLNAFPSYEYMPEQVQYMYPVSPAHYGAPHPQQTHYKVPETQIQAPPSSPARHIPAPVCQRPPFYAKEQYEPAFTPAPVYRPPCNPMEPVTTTTTIVLPVEEPVAPEPELVGQVYEETVSNKVFIEKGEEPGSTDVNHVMTYSVSEKSHFKTPEIEKLPQQMQYYFFLMN